MFLVLTSLWYMMFEAYNMIGSLLQISKLMPLVGLHKEHPACKNFCLRMFGMAVNVYGQGTVQSTIWATSFQVSVKSSVHIHCVSKKTHKTETV